jgi:hypothetical protein
MVPVDHSLQWWKSRTRLSAVVLVKVYALHFGKQI